MALEFVLLPETAAWWAMLLAIRRSMAKIYNSVSIPALRRGIRKRDALLLLREQTIRELERLVVEREHTVAEREQTLAKAEQTIDELQWLVVQRETTVFQREQTVVERERTIAELLVERERAIAELGQTIVELQTKFEDVSELRQSHTDKNHMILQLRDELAKRKYKGKFSCKVYPSVPKHSDIQVRKTNDELSAYIVRWKEFLANERFVQAGSQKFLDTYIVCKNLAGVLTYILISTREGRLWYDKFDLTEVPYLQMLGMIRLGDIVLDCGSNQGINSLMYSSIVGEAGHVHAFDPFPINCAIAKFNADINDRKNITTYQIALGNREEVKIVSIAAQDILEVKDATADTITATIARIDSLALRPNFIKIDVEGAEVDLLEGAVATLKFEPFIYLELHPDQISRFGRRVNEIFNFIDLQKYSCLVNYPGNPMLVEYSRQFELEHPCQMFFLPRSSPPVTRVF